MPVEPVKQSGPPRLDPIRLDETFHDHEYIEVEIGSGKGMYILGRASTHPAWGFLAIEIRSRLASAVRARSCKKGLANLVVLRADARLALPAMGPDGIVDLVTMHFPDPWWKRKHAKRAVVTDETVDQIVRLLKPEGRLFVQTDVFGRARTLLRLLTDDGRLRNTDPGGGLLETSPLACPSNRERTCAAAGQPVFRLLFAKPIRR